MNSIDDRLSDYDELSLLQLAESYLVSGQHSRALACCDQLIRGGPPQARYYDLRASVSGESRAFEDAVSDMLRAVALEPDNAAYRCRLGGYLVSREAARYGRIIDAPDRNTLCDIVEAYRMALERDPTRSSAWINLLEVLVMAERWDDAIACYGTSAPYIGDRALQLIRAFLGCLALALAGDEPFSEDLEPLENVHLRLVPGIYRFGEIDIFVQRLDARRFDRTQIATARKLRDRFVSHFTDEPAHYV